MKWIKMNYPNSLSGEKLTGIDQTLNVKKKKKL